jgi:hypothetical protein
VFAEVYVIKGGILQRVLGKSCVRGEIYTTKDVCVTGGEAVRL